MKIKLLFFGIIKDLLHQNTFDYTLESSGTIADFKISFLKTHENLKPYNFSVAVNEVYQDDAFVLKNGDVVALIPPVSGG
jgi:molybdopterin converting factor small subunit